MTLELKSDFAQTQANWDAFWEGTLGRPMMVGSRPKPGLDPVPWTNPYQFAFAEDLEPLVRNVRRWAETRDFLGDAVPAYQVSFGTDHFSALLGGDLKYSPDSTETTWSQPFVRDWDDVELRFQPEGRWWERTVKVIRALRQQCDGKLILFRPDLNGGLDGLVAVRGTGELMEDMVLAPDKVQRALTQLNRAFDEVIAALDAELGTAATGSVNRFGMYCRGRINVSQCDASCMISREMFDEFQMPCLRHEMNQHDVNCYHLDGPEAVHHVPSIASIPNLEIIQWRPKHNGRWRDSLPVYRQIDAAAKGHVFQTFLKLETGDLAQVCRELSSPRKVFDVSRLPIRTIEQLQALLAG